MPCCAPGRGTCSTSNRSKNLTSVGLLYPSAGCCVRRIEWPLLKLAPLLSNVLLLAPRVALARFVARSAARLAAHLLSARPRDMRAPHRAPCQVPRRATSHGPSCLPCCPAVRQRDRRHAQRLVVRCSLRLAACLTARPPPCCPADSLATCLHVVLPTTKCLTNDASG